MTTLTHTQLQELSENIEEAIDEWAVKEYRQEPRNHLGISEIGEECKRKIYYKFRWFGFEEFDGRMLRLFQRGHREEEKYINYLENIGCKVFRFDENGKQFRMSGVMDHYGGSCDGIVKTPWYPDIPMIAEFKTHNTKSFVGYIADGLLKAKPRHADQMNCYGYKLGIEYGIYFPENKNDDDIKITCLKLDWNRARQLETVAEEIIMAVEPPTRISDNPAFWKCKFCAFKENCHYKKPPDKNCRSCVNSKPIKNAQWFCSQYNQIIPKEFIKNGCDYHIPLK